MIKTIIIINLLILILSLLFLLLYSRNTINNKKIAFCFLIKKKINHEELWYNFFKNIDKSKYNIYIHYKKNNPLKYFEHYKINNTINTGWCKSSLVLAQNILLENAMKDKNNQNFIFISESCVPLKSFYYVYNTLDIKYSYFNHHRIYSFNKKHNIKLHKHSQWCILNRKHTQIILENTEKFNKILTILKYKLCCPDEYAYLTFLYYLGLEKELKIEKNLILNFTTFITGMGKIKYTKKNNETKINRNYTGANMFVKISKEDIEFLVKSKCLFGRKFKSDCKGIEYLNNFINYKV